MDAEHTLPQTLLDALRGGARVEVVRDAETTVFGRARLLDLVGAWGERYDGLGLRPGDRVALACTAGPGFLGAAIGAWDRGLTVVLSGASGDPGLLAEADARLAVLPEHLGGAAGGRGAGAGGGVGGGVIDTVGVPHAVFVRDDGRPVQNSCSPRDAAHPGEPDLRVLLRSSGTTASDGRGRWVGLSDRNILSVLRAHDAAIDRAGRRGLAMVPWRHAFGLVIDTLGALVGRAGAIVVVPGVEADASASARAVRELGIDWVCAVPLQINRLIGPLGLRASRVLSGVIGGAPVTRPLAEVLSGSRLRVGYGLTEASPGVCLGEPGVFEPFGIGTPVGCEIRLDRSDRLRVRGPNVHRYAWSADGGVAALDPGRWLDSGDLVATDPSGAFRYLGRVDHAFKLSNGRMVPAPALEAAIRDRLPGVIDARVSTDDHETIDVAVVTVAGTGGPAWGPARGAVRGLGPSFGGHDLRPLIDVVLGPLASRLGRIRVVTGDDAVWSGKGTIDLGAVDAVAARATATNAA